MYSNNANDIDYIYNQVNEWFKKGYMTSAVICKTDSEVNSIVKKLQAKGLDINTLSSNNKKYEGVVTNISSTASNKKFTVTIEFDNDGEVLVGMTSEVSI